MQNEKDIDTQALVDVVTDYAFALDTLYRCMDIAEMTQVT